MEEARSENAGWRFSGQVKNIIGDIRENLRLHSERQAALALVKDQIVSSEAPGFIALFAEFIQAEVKNNTGKTVNLRNARFALGFWQKVYTGTPFSYQKTPQHRLNSSLFSFYSREFGVRDKYANQVEQSTRIQLTSKVILGKDDFIYEPYSMIIDSNFLEGSLQTRVMSQTGFSFFPVGKEEDHRGNFVGILNYKGGREVYVQEFS